MTAFRRYDHLERCAHPDVEAVIFGTVHVFPKIDGTNAVLWCDGRCSLPLVAGARVEVRRSDLPVRLARLARPPFTDRLVAKFGLPVHGWRGHASDQARYR